MRIFRLGVAALFGVMLALASASLANARDLKFVSSQAALEQGLGAYKAGYYQIAVPALSFAAENGMFFGQYYLAQVYADNGSAFTNHARAYRLFLRIVEENANADPDDDQRAGYVGNALTAVAGYTRRGLPEIGLEPNAERAAKFLRDAANFFRNADAQFELAKMHLKGEGVSQERGLAFHWLSTLTQQGHAGAQAFLADLLWRGQELAKDEKRALALITVAVANAPESERIWIEDIYQNIFCGTSAGTRQQAEGLVAVWKRVYAPRAGTDRDERMGLGSPARSCQNGEALPRPERDSDARGAAPDADQRSTGTLPLREPSAMQGGAVASPSIGFREVGAARR